MSTSRPGDILIEMVQSVTPTGMEKFAAMLDEVDGATTFAQTSGAAEFVRVLSQCGDTGSHLAFRFLAAPRVVQGLADNGQARAVARMMKQQERVPGRPPETASTIGNRPAQASRQTQRR